eukprot:jgi/Mesen1/723/ME000011S00061
MSAGMVCSPLSVTAVSDKLHLNPHADPYIHDGIEAPLLASYDYIVVGGGTAGCPLAATLSSTYKVLVLERGGVPYDQPAVYRREGFPCVLGTNAAQPFLSVEGVENRRGNVLGGGSSVNAGFYSRASEDFIDAMQWDKPLVNESFRWVERQVVFTPVLGPWQTAFKDGLLEADVTPYNGVSLEHIIGTKIGNSIFDATGYRHTSADLLRSGTPQNLFVYIFSTVQKIIFEASTPGGASTSGGAPRATGVIFTDSAGVYHTATLNAGGEVLLTAGALGSPQLLLLSGVGPAADLAKYNVSVVLDLPTVGKNVTDIPINTINILSPIPVEEQSLQVVGIGKYGNIFEGASGGNHTVCWARAGEFTLSPPINRSSDISPILSVAYDVIGNNFLTDALNQAGFILSKVYRPLARGEMTLTSTNISDNPLMQYNYYNNPHDIEVCINGSRVLRKILKSRAFAPFRYNTTDAITALTISGAGAYGTPYDGATPLLPNSDNYTEAAQWCKDTVSVIWHFHGGCHVGDCVDATYRVLGADSLRVIDGSTWLTSPGTNPQATCMMLGRYMGIKILRERAQRQLVAPVPPASP